MPECKAKYCTVRRGQGINTFSIPDPQMNYNLCKQWIDNLGNAKLNIDSFKFSYDKIVCERHFEEDCFELNMQAKIMNYKPRFKKLKEGAVPTIFIEPNATNRNKDRNEGQDAIDPEPCCSTNVSAPKRKRAAKSPEKPKKTKKMTEKTHNTRGRTSRKIRTERKRDVSTFCNIQIDTSPSFCVKCFLRENPDFPVNDHFYHKPKSEMDIQTNGIPVHVMEDIKTEILETEPETDIQTTGTPVCNIEDIKIEILETEPETDIQTTGTIIGAIENIKMETLETEPETDVQTTGTATQMHTMDDTKIGTSETDNTSILMSIKEEPSSDDSNDFNIFSASENQNMEPSSNFCTLSDHSQFPVSLLCLKTLFCMLACQICKEPFEPHATVYNCNGSGLSANLTCVNGHIFSWTSLQISKL